MSCASLRPGWPGSVPRTFLLLAFASAFGQWAEGADKVSPDDLHFFESKIRPVLARHCYTCHSAEAKTAMGGLRLDSREGVLRGGNRGEAIVPGSAADSLLLEALSYESELKMPPTGKLSAQVIADFRQWVERGAPDPREQAVVKQESQIDLKKGRRYWAFQAPERPKLPPVNDLSWPRGAVDQFLLAKREQAGLPAVADADRPALLRRATFDLLGLPPTPKEIDSFVNDPDENAFRKVVDRLLQSPRFGERWGRHWLDVARYGETMGRTLNYPFPVAWRYRDYVIDAFNRDKPYDRFVGEQIAGDLLPSESDWQRREQVTATGFLALGAHDLNEPDRALYPMDVADEMINVTSRTILGLTVGCARCHDHKFDPIPTRDYYALAGIFRSTELKGGLRQRPKYGAGYFKVDKLMRLDRASSPAESGADGPSSGGTSCGGRSKTPSKPRTGRRFGTCRRNSMSCLCRGTWRWASRTVTPYSLAASTSGVTPTLSGKRCRADSCRCLIERLPAGRTSATAKAAAGNWRNGWSGGTTRLRRE